MRRYRTRNRIERLLTVARAEVGYKEQGINFTKYGAWIGMNGQPWCAMFVSWVGQKSNNGDIIPRTASCIVGVNWFKQRGLWGNTPQVGALIYFGNGYPTHIGIVEVVDRANQTITTIEGNANDQVERRSYKFNFNLIYGYGYPRY